MRLSPSTRYCNRPTTARSTSPGSTPSSPPYRAVSPTRGRRSRGSSAAHHLDQIASQVPHQSHQGAPALPNHHHHQHPSCSPLEKCRQQRTHLRSRQRLRRTGLASKGGRPPRQTSKPRILHLPSPHKPRQTPSLRSSNPLASRRGRCRNGDCNSMTAQTCLSLHQLPRSNTPPTIAQLTPPLSRDSASSSSARKARSTATSPQIQRLVRPSLVLPPPPT